MFHHSRSGISSGDSTFEAGVGPKISANVSWLIFVPQAAPSFPNWPERSTGASLFLAEVERCSSVPFQRRLIDDESTILFQHLTFPRKRPPRAETPSLSRVNYFSAFPHPMDVSIHASTGQIQIRSTEGGKDKVETHHLGLPPDLANGVILALMKNMKRWGPHMSVAEFTSQVACQTGYNTHKHSRERYRRTPSASRRYRGLSLAPSASC